MSNLLSENKVHGNAETLYHTLIISFKLIVTIIHDRTTHVQKGQATIGHPFLNQLDIYIQMTYDYTICVKAS